MSDFDPGNSPQEPVRYDLAGNPIPSAPPSYGNSQNPSPPPAPIGYAPPGVYAPKQPVKPPQKKQKAIPFGMEEAITNGSNWIFGVAGLTLVSLWLTCLTYPISVPYVSYAALSSVVGLALGLGAVMHYPVAAAIGSLAIIPFAGLGVLGHKRQAWVFMVAMIIYGIDIPISWVLNFGLFGLLLGTTWHGWVFSRMFTAFTACREVA